MKLTLVRHGRPDEDNTERPHDPPLRADGLRQAQAVAALLASEGVTRVVTSPQLRARETAAPLAARLGLSPDILDGWAEADRHLARYRSTETLRALGDTEWGRFLADPVRYLGHDPLRFQADVLGALQQVLGGPADGHVLVFTHGLPINVVLSHILGLERIIHFQPGYGSVTRLRTGASDAQGGMQRIGIVSVNETGHHRLPAP
jgi:broad specificity phosphatase PhoE